jgi:hypothetical protein
MPATPAAIGANRSRPVSRHHVGGLQALDREVEHRNAAGHLQNPDAAARQHVLNALPDDQPHVECALHHDDVRHREREDEQHCQQHQHRALRRVELCGDGQDDGDEHRRHRHDGAGVQHRSRRRASGCRSATVL